MKETQNALELNVTQKLIALTEKTLVNVRDLITDLFHKKKKSISILWDHLRPLSLNNTFWLTSMKSLMYVLMLDLLLQEMSILIQNSQLVVTYWQRDLIFHNNVKRKKLTLNKQVSKIVTINNTVRIKDVNVNVIILFLVVTETSMLTVIANPVNVRLKRCLVRTQIKILKEELTSLLNKLSVIS